MITSETAMPSSPAPTAPHHQPIRILAVDDNETNLQVYRAALDLPGYEVIAVGSGTEAIAELEKGSIALVMLDVMMPDPDGFSTAEQIRKVAEWRDVPIIFITAARDEQSLLRGAATGAVDYLTKPLKRDILIWKVRALTALSKRILDLKAENDHLRATLGMAQRGSAHKKSAVLHAHTGPRTPIRLPEYRDPYLALPPEIYGAMPKRPLPVTLYFEDGRGQKIAYAQRDEELERDARTEAARLAAAEELFIERGDVAHLAPVIAPQLELLVSDKRFDLRDKATLLVACLSHDIDAIYTQPVSENFEALRSSLETTVHLLEGKERLAGWVLSNLPKQHSLTNKAINNGFLGLLFALFSDVDMLELDNHVGLGLAFFLCDIGLSYVPAFILDKQGSLTRTEWNKIKTHPLVSLKMLERMGFDHEAGKQCVLQHHERGDSTGYPHGLPDTEANYLAQLLAVIDSYTGMTLSRPSKPGMRHESAMAELISAQAKYNPGIVNAFEEMLLKLQRAADRRDP